MNNQDNSIKDKLKTIKFCNLIQTKNIKIRITNF